jgi:hypothetical protein
MHPIVTSRSATVDHRKMVPDEGMTNRPSIFAYLVFGPGRITVEGIARPIKTAV